MLLKGLNLLKEQVVKVDAASNSIETDKGNLIKYDYLVICPGVKLRYDLIPGSLEALEDPNSPVGSIYRLDFAYKAS